MGKSNIHFTPWKGANPRAPIHTRSTGYLRPSMAWIAQNKWIVKQFSVDYMGMGQYL